MKRAVLVATGMLLAFAFAPVPIANAGEREARKEVRAEFAKDKKPMFWDAMYYLDLEKLSDSRWTIPDKPPYQSVEVAKGVSEDVEHLLYDAQTSGGLLIAISPGHADALATALEADDFLAERIGRVEKGSGVRIEA